MLSYPTLLKKHLLTKRWKGEEERIEMILRSIQDGCDWTIYLVEHPNHKWCALKYIDDKDLITVPGEAGPRDLRGICLKNIDFGGVANLSDTTFKFSKLTDVNFASTCLNAANFSNTLLFGDIGCNFINSKLSRINFSKARIQNTDFSDSLGLKINLNDAKVTNCNFSNADWRSVKLSYEPFWWHFVSSKYFSSILFYFGVQYGTDLRNTLPSADNMEKSDSRFIDFMSEEQQIDYQNKQYKLISLFMYFTSNYGRSLTRILSWITITWLFFGFLYSPVPKCINNSVIRTGLEAITPDIDWGSKEIFDKNTNEFVTRNISTPGSFSPYYFSMVTMTSLGYGDIKPVDSLGQIYCCLEIFIGLILFGVIVGYFFGRYSQLKRQV